MKSVLVIDTSILCVWLDVPGMTNCGPDNDKWDKARVEAKINEERAKALADLMRKSAQE